MTTAEIDALLSPALRDWVALHRQEDPHRLALQKHVVDFPIALAIGQVALLQKAAEKLPWLARNQCVLLPKAYEQATAESLTGLKPWGEGKAALDLTCGLGCDSLAMAEHYAQVTSLEPDAELARVVRFNADVLGITNLNVLAQTAEDFLEHYAGPPFDLVYVDPDRRDAQGKRVYGLHEGSPNALALLDQMRQHGRRILIKASPMLDLQAVRRLFPVGCFTWVMAEANECKEILIEPDAIPGTGAIFFRKQNSWIYESTEDQPFVPTWDPSQTPQYIYEMDAALYKAGLAAQFPGVAAKGGMLIPEGYFFSQEDDPHFHGHRFRVKAAWPWKPQTIKSDLKKMGITKVQYTRRDFDLPITDIRKQITLPEGGDLFLLLTRMGEKTRWAFLAERL
jgi:predicted O-methyltransferase YrrM